MAKTIAAAKTKKYQYILYAYVEINLCKQQQGNIPNKLTSTYILMLMASVPYDLKRINDNSTDI